MRWFIQNSSRISKMNVCFAGVHLAMDYVLGGRMDMHGIGR